jgi:hypothetical protein
MGVHQPSKRLTSLPRSRRLVYAAPAVSFREHPHQGCFLPTDGI